MELFGQNFLKIRNDFVLPSISFGIKEKKTPYWALKDVVTTKLTGAKKISNNIFELEIPKEYFYNSLHSDIELFLNKSYVQYNDFLISTNGCQTWSFVTLYYFAFFSMTTFFRLNRKGYVYLNKEHTSNLENFFLAVNSSPISLNPGNYYFQYESEDASGNAIIKLVAKGEGIHRLHWIQLENTIRDYLPNCDADEEVVFKIVLDLFATYDTDFPSNLRNQLNYFGISSELDLHNTIPFPTLTINKKKLMNNLINFDSRNGSISNKIYAVSCIASLFFNYATELHSEYLNRSKFGKDFLKTRNEFIRKKGLLLD